jgi:toxin ParE1/3/4
MPPRVARYTLTRDADFDIAAIAEFSVTQWGLARAEEYILALHPTFQTLANFPDVGRDAGAIRAGYRSLESGAHSVFYRKSNDGVEVVRVLHQSMDFGRHL